MSKRAAVINDYASFGRCSLAVSIPILAAMKVQCCAVPTAIFTNHTGFESFSWVDFTDRFQTYIDEWKKLKLTFDAIQTGFLGSERQIDYVLDFIRAFKRPGTLVLVDPVMGDYGRLYSTYSEELARGMRSLLPVADILTPNLTEACILAGEEYRSDMEDEKIFSICEELSEANGANVVVTGVQRGANILNFAYESAAKRRSCMRWKKIGGDRSGTGDVFSSVVLGNAVNGVAFDASVARAGQFVSSAVAATENNATANNWGLDIEDVLGELIV